MLEKNHKYTWEGTLPLKQTTEILIAEDNIGIQKLLTEVLNEEGYHVVNASNGFEALVEIENIRPNLLLLDLRLPGKDGTKVLEEMNDQHPEVPVIVMTGFQEINSIEDMKQLGAKAYFSKPFDIKEVVEAVHTNLSRNNCMEVME